MSIRTEAEENLRIIRSLMEKATIYRAISAPGALVAGFGAVAVAAYGIFQARPGIEQPAQPFRFTVPWIALMGFIAVVNLALLARDAARRGEPFVSPGMRLALRAMIPALLGGGIVVLPLLMIPGSAPVQALVWVLFYGISLLAASHFAPKAICWLGRAFFATGFTLFFLWGMATRSPLDWLLPNNCTIFAHGVMGVTFGLFHVVYAALTWPRRTGTES